MVASAHAETRPARAGATIAAPIVKWAGGKTRLLPELLTRVPQRLGSYYEPFAGGAALFFALQPASAVLGDVNADLIAMYSAVADDVEAVIAHLERHREKHCETHYAGVRARWNAGDDKAHGRAAAFLYLNRTCFNGLWRVNSAGAFNVPMGRYADPLAGVADKLRAAAPVLARATLRCGDYGNAVASAGRGAFVYFDPPYDGTWTGYTAEGFGEQQQRELAATARDLVDRGVRVMLSNSDTPLVRELYDGFGVERVGCARSINSDVGGRGAVDELIITGGYEPSRERTRIVTLTDYESRAPDAPEQLELAGHETPVATAIPAIDMRLREWLARQAMAKEQREAAALAHTKLLEIMLELGVSRVAYVDTGGKKRVAFATTGDPRVKTQAAPSGDGKASRTKPSKAEAVESCRVPRTAEHDRAADPFGAARSVLDEASERQAEDSDALVIPDDAPEAEEAPPRPQRAKPEKFDAQMLADGRCALRFEGGNACSQDVGHSGLHKSSTHSWKARRPKPPEATSAGAEAQ